MPELPEVEVVRSGLNRFLIGKSIASVEFDWTKSFPNDKTQVDKFLISATVKQIHRMGKVIQVELDNDYSLIIHLKMTGQLIYRGRATQFGGGHPSDSLIGELPDKSTRVNITFTDKSKLYFNDQRKFGWMKLVPTLEIPSIDFFKKLGPEPLGPAFTIGEFSLSLFKRTNTSIKAALLDQSVVAGIGNIYADESLWAAKIHPSTLVKNLSKAKIASLHRSIRAVLELSVKNGGSTDRNYVDVEGRKGNYLIFANVFRLEGQPCKRCGTTIIKIRVAGRGTHICPHCQRLKK